MRAPLWVVCDRKIDKREGDMGITGRRADSRPLTLWLTGTVLIWLILVVPVVDVVLAPEWFAPHPQCDSLMIPIMLAAGAALPWAAVSLALAGLLTWGATARRAGGGDVLDLRQSLSARTVAALVIALCLAAPFAYDLASWVRDTLTPRSWTVDCNGRADPLEVTLRRPLFQLMPLLDLALIWWILHLRAWAVSPRAGTVTPVATDLTGR